LTKLRGSVRLSDVLDRFAVAAFGHWRERLAALLDALWEHKSQTRHFAAKLFLFFIGLNVACY
jgi:alpha-D-ribose 1-methylphosphonate 5-triphosphate synthase subunit PhnG